MRKLFLYRESCPLKIRTRNNKFILWWLTGVPHGPGIYETEFVSATATGAKLGDRKVVAIAYVDSIFCSELGKAKKQYDRLIVNNAT